MIAPAQILTNATRLLGFKPAIDGMMSAISGKFIIDIIKFDEQLAMRDSDYDLESCTYKGNVVSIKEYILLKYGEETFDAIALLF